MKPIAIQLYTVRDALSADWQGTLEKIAELGFIGVEMAGFGYAPSREAVIDKLTALNLQVVGAHGPLLTDDNSAELIDMMQALGNPNIICAGTSRDGWGTAEDLAAQVAEYNRAGEIARANGLRFGIHNHWWEFAEVDGRNAYDVVIEQLADDIFLEVDTYWVQTSGANVVDFVTKHAARSMLLHIKDGPCTPDGDMLAVGAGKMDFAPIIAGGVSAEYLIVELDRCATDMMTAVAESYDYLVGNGLAQGNK